MAFADLYRTMIDPVVAECAAISHLVFQGSDGVESGVEIDDAMSDRFLIADRLDGKPLGPEHGGPARVVSPDQYGYISVKYLTRIELRTREPRDLHRRRLSTRLAMLVLQPHPPRTGLGRGASPLSSKLDAATDLSDDGRPDHPKQRAQPLTAPEATPHSSEEVGRG